MFDFFKRKDPEVKVITKYLNVFRSAYKASKTSDLLFNWDTKSHSIDYIVKANLTPLRARSREQARNNDHARRFLQLVKNNVVGANGFIMQSQIKDFNGLPDRLANDAVEASYKTWSRRENCDWTEKQSFTDLCKLFISTVAEDGEVLIIKKKQDGEFKLLFIDPERLDVSLEEKLSGGRYIKHGIEYSEDGKRLAYWIIKDSDSYSKKYERVEAKYIIHEFIVEKAGQKRGIPWMSTALIRLNMLNAFEEASLVNARVGASKMGFFYSPDGDAVIGEEQEDGSLIMDAEAGSMQQLPNGVQFTSFDPDYPNGEFSEFVKASLHGIASGLGVNYHSLASDLSQVNYSSARVGEIIDQEMWKAIQQWTIEVFVVPVFEEWLEYALKTGKIFINDNNPVSYSEDRFKKFSAIKWQARRWKWVDPLKEIQANEKAIALKVKSRSEIIRDLGRDPEDVWRELASEEELMKSIGLSVDIDNKGVSEDEQTAND